MVQADERRTDAGLGYSIRVCSRLTGLTPDTLRMWERRYGFPRPRRKDSGVRVYGEADVEKLVLIARALKAGYRAGEVVHLSVAELQAHLDGAARAGTDPAGATPSVTSLLSALANDDVPAVRHELRQAVATLGPRRFLAEVAGPLVRQVGDAWATGRLQVRHEHLFSELLSTQLRLLLSAFEVRRGGHVVVLATLPGEQHGLGLEMAALYLAVAGAQPRLLGVDTPIPEVAEAARALGARAVGISVSLSTSAAVAARQVEELVEALPPTVELWLGGERSRSLPAYGARVRRLPDWDALSRALTELDVASSNA